MKYLIAIILLVASMQAKSEAVIYLDIAADWDLELKPDQDLGAHIELGIRFPMDNGITPYASIGDQSFWFVGPPFNDDAEINRQYIRVGVEFTW